MLSLKSILDKSTKNITLTDNIVINKQNIRDIAYVFSKDRENITKFPTLYNNLISQSIPKPFIEDSIINENYILFEDLLNIYLNTNKINSLIIYSVVKFLIGNYLKRMSKTNDIDVLSKFIKILVEKNIVIDYDNKIKELFQINIFKSIEEKLRNK